MIKVNDLLKTKQGNMRCIATSKDTAVLAPYSKKRDGGIKTKFSNMIAVHPAGMGFEFEKTGKLKIAS